MDIVELFCVVDDFWKDFDTKWHVHLLSENRSLPKRSPSLCMSEVTTIIILFHITGYRNFKNFYLGHVCQYLKSEFSNCPSYNQFLNLKKQALFPLYCLLMSLSGSCTGISFIDSTSLVVCHTKRAHSHKTFKGLAKKGKTTKG